MFIVKVLSFGLMASRGPPAAPMCTGSALMRTCGLRPARLSTPFNASYPTFGRITEVMNTLQTMGAHVIRSQTLGVSVGNPLSVMPALGEYNEQAFATIDWSVFQARQHGLRIVAPLVDNYGGQLALRGCSEVD